MSNTTIGKMFGSYMELSLFVFDSVTLNRFKEAVNPVAFLSLSSHFQRRKCLRGYPDNLVNILTFPLELVLLILIIKV